MHEQTSLNRIIGSSLHGISGLANEFLDRLHREIVKHRLLYTQPSQIADLARERLNDFEPLLAEHLSDATLASWVNGYDSVTSLFPKWLQDEFATTIRNQPPIDPPKINLFPMFGEWEPRLKLPNIENAAKRLIERNILTRPSFDAADESAQREAFTIAGDLKEDTIGRLRQFLVDDLHSGTSLDGFENRVKEHLGTSPIAPAHLENVYRTNIQGALRDGRETIRQNPIVKTLFPYQEYIPIHDGRTRHHHYELGHLGLNGTGIYRVDDPFWDYFTPPWHYNCRCGTRLLTVDQAAAAGVHEAMKWMRTGFEPIIPEHRLQHIPFPPNPGWGSRGRVGVIAMSLIPYRR